MMQKYTLRVPRSWAASLRSDVVRFWLDDLFRSNPRRLLLADDPGPGDGQVSLRLDRRKVRMLAALGDCSETGALRRLISLNASALPEASMLALPAPGGSQTLESQPVALLPSQSQGDGQGAVYRDPRTGFWMIRDSRSGVWYPHSPSRQPAPLSYAPRVRPFDWWMALPAFWGVAAIAVALFSILSGVLGGGGAAPGGGSAAGPTFTSWTPGG